MTMTEDERLIGEIRDVIWWLDGYLAAKSEHETMLKNYHIKALEKTINIIVDRN